MPLDIQQIKLEIAKRHNVMLDDNDPILVTLSLNELVLGEQLKQVNEMLSSGQEHVLAATDKQVAASKEIASKVVTEAAGYVATQTQKTVDTMQTRLLETFEQKMVDARLDINRSKKVAFWAALISVSVASFMIGITLATWLHR